MNRTAFDLKDQLNRCMPVAQAVKLGILLEELITQVNSVRESIRTNIVLPATLAIKSGTSPTVKSTGQFVVRVDGTVVVKAANTDMSALVGTLATAKAALWAFYIDSAGTITTSTKTADADDDAAALLLKPAVPDGKVELGYIIVENATGSGFVGGTTALDAEDVTVTYTNNMTFAADPLAESGDMGDLASRT